jgi:hypothetical protein
VNSIANPTRVGRVTPCAPQVNARARGLFATHGRRARSDAPCLFRALLVTAFAALAISTFAQTNPVVATRFRAVDIFVDSTNKPLAAYQLEFTASAGAKIVGIEGGEHAAFLPARRLLASRAANTRPSRRRRFMM